MDTLQPINHNSSKALPDFIAQENYLKESFLLDLLPAAVYVCDAEGYIKKYNQKAVELWGRKPRIGDKDERFCGALKLYMPDGTHLPHDQTPVAACLSDGNPRENLEVIVERPDLSRIIVRVNIVPIKDEEGTVRGMINCFYDITAEKETETALKRKTFELQDYVDNAAVALHWVDEKGVIIWANKAELNMLGYSAEEYIGRHISEFHVDQEKIRDLLHRLGRNETLQEFESNLRCKDGTVKTVHITSNVFRENGRFVHTRCFTHDVTKQKQLYDSLQESRLKYLQLLMNLPVAIYTCDKDGYITMFNEAATELWGREPVPGKDKWCGSFKIFTPQGTPLDLNACPMAVCLRENRAVNDEEIVVQRPDGTKKHVIPHPRPLYDTSGRQIGAVNMLMDITGLKLVENALRESEERFRTAANAAPVLIWMSDTTGSRYFFNRSWLSYTGRALNQVSGEGWANSVHPEDRARVLELYYANFRRKQEYRTEYRLLRADNEYRWMLSHALPRYTPAGSFEGFIGTVIDIHEQKLYKEELERQVTLRTEELTFANSMLELSNRELEQFAYVASHDLQEPLRKISMLSDLLRKRSNDKLDEEELALIGRMQSASLRMKTLIDDLLSYSRVEKVTHKEPVDTVRVIGDVLIDLEALMHEKNAVVKTEKLYPLWGNALQIRQLFQNLLGNALKFTKPGTPPEIHLGCRLVRGSESGFELHGEALEKEYQLVEVRDNGIGFDEQYADRIFQVFQRLHGRSEYPGSGVGLAIVHKIVTNHGGFIKARGTPGEGAVFQILFPVPEHA